MKNPLKLFSRYFWIRVCVWSAVVIVTLPIAMILPYPLMLLFGGTLGYYAVGPLMEYLDDRFSGKE